MDIFDSKAILPMQIPETKAPFNSPDWIYELKLDGIRCLAYLNYSSTDLRNKLNQPLLPKFPELDKLHYLSNAKCILDGELIVLKNGVPDFYELQRRLIQLPYHCQRNHDGSDRKNHHDGSDQLNKYASSHPRTHVSSDPLSNPPYYSASFVAYDIIYYKDHTVTDISLMERKHLLEQILNETVDLAISRYTEERGVELFRLAVHEKLEGVIAKRKDSLYCINEATTSWVKFQKLLTSHYILCGILYTPNGRKRFLLGQYHRDTLVYKGSVDITTFDSKDNNLVDYVHHVCERIPDSPFLLAPIWSQEYRQLWFKPQLVCSIEHPSMDHPGQKNKVFRGICEDVLPQNCIATSS